MSSTTGVAVIGAYSGAVNDGAAVQILLDLLPNPDSTSTSGAAAASGNGAGFLDEISPAALVQLRVELVALKAAVSTTNTL